MESIHRFDLGPGPGGLAQELQAGFNTRIKVKTPHLDAAPEFLPAVVVNQLLEDCLECQAMQRVFPAGRRRRGCARGAD